MAQTDKHTNGHGNSMTNSAQWGRVGEKHVHKTQLFMKGNSQTRTQLNSNMCECVFYSNHISHNNDINHQNAIYQLQTFINILNNKLGKPILQYSIGQYHKTYIVISHSTTNSPNSSQAKPLKEGKYLIATR